MDGQTATEILTNPKVALPEKSEQTIRESAKAVFLEEYEKLIENDPTLEAKIFGVKGLMSELFQFKKKKHSFRRRRKSHNSLGQEDNTSQKKKVRFNISSNIYEEASAIQDESVSVIEPLSIFSNVSPPGELVTPARDAWNNHNNSTNQ